MSNPKDSIDFEINCVFWNNERTKENKWKIVDDASGKCSISPDLLNIKVENNEVCIDDEKGEAFRISDGQKQTLDYKETKKIRDERIKTRKIKELEDNGEKAI